MKCNALVYLKQMMKYNSKEAKQGLIPKFARQKKKEQANKEDPEPAENKTDSLVNKDIKEVLSGDEQEENKGIKN